VEIAWGVAGLGALLALDHAMVGQFMLSQPVVTGGILGAATGDAATGLLVGALVQLLYIGVVSVGAYIPSDHAVTGGICTVLTNRFIHVDGYSMGISITLALALAIPAGALAAQLDMVSRQRVNDRLVRWVEARVDRGQEPWLGGLNLLAILPSFLRGFVVYVVWLALGSAFGYYVLPHFPPRVLVALSLVFWALPVLAFAVLFEIASRERMHGVAALAMTASYLLLLIWPQWVIGIVLGITLIIALLFRHQREA
jgi:mannose/fructose/N-acetylgalactosamine-specific phosphotransferase system component IIC